MNLWTLNALVLASTTINGITDQKVDPKFEELALRGNGDLWPTFSAMLKQEPMLAFTSLDIATVLGFTGISGASCTNAVLWFKPFVNQGSRSTSGKKVTAATALVVPKSIKLTHGKEATIDCEVYAISSNGTTAPLIAATGTAPVGSGVNEAWTLGPVTIGGTAIGGVQEVTIDFGIKVLVKGGDGAIYPTFVCKEEQKPKITVKSTDAGKAADYLAAGSSVAVVTSILGITKGGGLSGNNISLASTEGRLHGSTSGGDEQSGEFMHLPTYDGTNDVLALVLP